MFVTVYVLVLISAINSNLQIKVQQPYFAQSHLCERAANDVNEAKTNRVEAIKNFAYCAPMPTLPVE